MATTQTHYWIVRAFHHEKETITEQFPYFGDAISYGTLLIKQGYRVTLFDARPVELTVDA